MRSGRPLRRHPLSDGILYSHYSDVDPSTWPWQHFPPRECSCPHCGELFVHPRSLDGLERVRHRIGRPMPLNSGHRCWIHNIRVGGRAGSTHRYFAGDVSTVDLDPVELYHAAVREGFGAVGGYLTFMHLDMRQDGRRWYGSEASKRVWRRHFSVAIPPDVLV